MHIELEQAIKIYARVCRSWYGGKAHNVAIERAREFRARGDHDGFAVWRQLAAELQVQAETAPRP
jgi:hypothetical protein